MSSPPIVHATNAYKVPTMCWVLGTKDITKCNKVSDLLELTLLYENKTIKMFPVLERKFLYFYYNLCLYYKVSVTGNQRLSHSELDILASRTRWVSTSNFVSSLTLKSSAAQALHLVSRNNTWASWLDNKSSKHGRSG